MFALITGQREGQRASWEGRTEVCRVFCGYPYRDLWGERCQGAVQESQGRGNQRWLVDIFHGRPILKRQVLNLSIQCIYALLHSQGVLCMSFSNFSHFWLLRYWQNLTGSKLSSFQANLSTKMAWPLIWWDFSAFNFSFATNEQIWIKLDSKQVPCVLYQVFFSQADRSTKMISLVSV